MSSVDLESCTYIDRERGRLHLTIINPRRHIFANFHETKLLRSLKIHIHDPADHLLTHSLSRSNGQDHGHPTFKAHYLSTEDLFNRKGPWLVTLEDAVGLGFILENLSRCHEMIRILFKVDASVQWKICHVQCCGLPQPKGRVSSLLLIVILRRDHQELEDVEGTPDSFRLTRRVIVCCTVLRQRVCQPFSTFGDDFFVSLLSSESIQLSLVSLTLNTSAKGLLSCGGFEYLRLCYSR